MDGLLEQPEWMASAVCAQTDAELFFPEPGGTPRAAYRVCAGCPVRKECLDFAIEHGEMGVWGGTSDLQRRRLRKEHA